MFFVLFVILISNISVFQGSDVVDDIFLPYVCDNANVETDGPGRSLKHADFISWKHKPIIEKLHYLLDERDLRLLYQDYKYTLSHGIPPATDPHSNIYITYEILHTSLREFRSKDMIDTFWMSCDVDKDGVMTFTEYVVCRGDFDASANPSVINEYDLRANGIISDYEALLQSGKRIPDLYQYDENGIIID